MTSGHGETSFIAQQRYHGVGMWWCESITAMEIACISLRSDFTSRNFANAVFCRCLLQVVKLA